MNERNEINGDLDDEHRAILEALIADDEEQAEANRDAPEPEPLTDEELDDWAREWETEDWDSVYTRCEYCGATFSLCDCQEGF